MIYLLENVCAYLNKFSAAVGSVKVVFEERNHNYQALRNYLKKIQRNPLNHQARSLTLLNSSGIETSQKGADEFLILADFVAHFLYQCVNKTPNNFYIPETRYFSEMSGRFACNSDGVIDGVGLKFVHSLTMLNLDSDVERVFTEVRGKVPSAWDKDLSADR